MLNATQVQIHDSNYLVDSRLNDTPTWAGTGSTFLTCQLFMLERFLWTKLDPLQITKPRSNQFQLLPID